MPKHNYYLNVADKAKILKFLKLTDAQIEAFIAAKGLSGNEADRIRMTSRIGGLRFGEEGVRLLRLKDRKFLLEIIG